MSDKKFEYLEKIKNNVQSWYNFYGANISVNLISRSLYKYEGQMDRSGIRSTQAKAHEVSLHETYGYFGSSGIIGLGNMGLSQSTLLNNQYAAFHARTASDLREHFDLPVYQNIIGALHNSVMGGLTKSQIDVTIQPKNDYFNEEFESMYANSVLESYPNPNQQQSIKQAIEDNKKEEQAGQKGINTLCGLIESSINDLFEDIYNKDALMSSLDNLCTMGYSALKCELKKDRLGNDEIGFDLVENPEHCFFSPLAHLKDRSDGRFCGMLKLVDREQINVWYEKVLKKEQMSLESLENFKLSVPFILNGYFKPESYLIICQYYEKVTENGKEAIKMCVTCDNFIFEETILEEYTDLPIVFIDSSFGNRFQTSSIFGTCLSLQKQYNELKYKLCKMIPTLSTGKVIVPSPKSAAAADALSTGGFTESLAILYDQGAGTNASFTPAVMSNIDFPAVASNILNQILSEMQYIINGLMSGDVTKGGESSAAISGRSRAIGSMNHNNLFSGRLNCFINGLNKICNIFCNMFFRVYSKSKNPKYRMLKSMNEATFYNVLLHSALKVYFSADLSFNKEINRQSVLELMKINQDPLLHKVLFMNYCENLESSGQGELLNAVKDALEILAKQEQQPQQDPRMQVEMMKLESENSENERQRQFQAIENEKDRTLKLEEKIIDGEFRMSDAQLTHHQTLTAQQNQMAHQITLQGLQDAAKLSNQAKTNV